MTQSTLPQLITLIKFAGSGLHNSAFCCLELIGRTVPEGHSLSVVKSGLKIRLFHLSHNYIQHGDLTSAVIATETR